MVLLPFGGLLGTLSGFGLLGWVFGAILLLTSGVWSRNDKVLGLLLFPGGLAFPLLLLNLVGEVCMSSTVDRRTTQSCTGTSLPPVLGIPLLIVLVVTPLVVAAHLASKLRTRS